MATNTTKTESSKKTGAKRVVENAMGTMKDSLKLLESVVKVPNLKHLKEQKKLAQEITNEKILSGLKSLGVATQSEVATLKKQIKALEDKLAELASQKNS